MSEYQEQDPSFSTKAIHTAQEPEQWSSKDVVTPITLSTTFKMRVPEIEKEAFIYGTYGNPSRDNLESCLAALEGAKHGLCFSSGMAAVLALVHTLRAGDHLVCMKNVYGGTYKVFTTTIWDMGMTSTLVDDGRNIEEAIQKNTKMVWVEGLSNPLLQAVDLRKTVERVHCHQGVLLVVDNTFISPYFQRPLSLGVDVVMHSCTKYINGHNDVVMGALMTNHDALSDKLRTVQKCLGSTPSSFDCYLVARSLKTLHLRMEAHMKNGREIATFLEAHPCVEKVLHPGLKSHPQHELMKEQCSGYSGMVSFYIRGGREDTRRFLMSLKLFTLASSLGGTNSLASLPSQLSHVFLPEAERQSLGVTDSLVRLSVGLEAAADLIRDLKQALGTLDSGR